MLAIIISPWVGFDLLQQYFFVAFKHLLKIFLFIPGKVYLPDVCVWHLCMCYLTALGIVELQMLQVSWAGLSNPYYFPGFLVVRIRNDSFSHSTTLSSRRLLKGRSKVFSFDTFRKVDCQCDICADNVIQSCWMIQKFQFLKASLIFRVAPNPGFGSVFGIPIFRFFQH